MSDRWLRTPATEIAIEEPNNSVRLARLFLMFHRSGVEIPTPDAGNRTSQVVGGMAIFASELAPLTASDLQVLGMSSLVLVARSETGASDIDCRACSFAERLSNASGGCTLVGPLSHLFWAARAW